MSHFSTIKTQLKESEPLIKALNHFGYNINQEEKFVKGYKGQFTAVDNHYILLTLMLVIYKNCIQQYTSKFICFFIVFTLHTPFFLSYSISSRV